MKIFKIVWKVFSTIYTVTLLYVIAILFGTKKVFDEVFNNK